MHTTDKLQTFDAKRPSMRQKVVPIENMFTRIKRLNIG